VGNVTEPLCVGQGDLRLILGVLSLTGWQYLRCPREQWRRKTGQFARGEIKRHTRDSLSYIVRLSTNKNPICELRPGLDRDFDDKRVACNSIGARARRAYAPGRKPDTIRIVGSGDSGMFGWGCRSG
jgi:hypothetical protein